MLPGLLAERRVEARDAAFATELAYGTLRMRGLYDEVLAACVDRPLTELDGGVLDALRLGTHQLLGMRVPPHAAVGETVALVRQNLGGGPGALVNAVLRRVSGTDRAGWIDRVAPDPSSDPLGHLAVVHSHPAWIVRALREALAGAGVPSDRLHDELAALLAADNDAPQVTLVARPGLCEVDELVTAGGTAGGFSPFAVHWPTGDPGRLPAVRQARAAVQDEGSQLVALALSRVGLVTGAHGEARPAGARGSDHVDAGAGTGSSPRWLDLCAGPGGKAALLGAIVRQQRGSLVAVEQTPHRADLVRAAVARLGDAVEVRVGDGQEVGQTEPGAYDRVLVDAPCTGLGALRRRPESRWRRQPADVSALAPLQRSLLASGLDAVRPGGAVAYVTCSPHVAETRLVVQDAIRRRDDVELVDARPLLAGVPDLGDGPTVQLWPHRHGTDAMFLAVLRRR